MSDVVAEVSQYSRESGRAPAHVLHERLENERKKLVGEKQMIEAKLSDIASQKSDKLAAVYRRRMHRSDAIAATNEIQSEFSSQRAKLIRDKTAVEERLHDIKRRFSATAEVRDDVKVLLRIESLLVRIVNHIEAK